MGRMVSEQTSVLAGAAGDSDWSLSDSLTGSAGHPRLPLSAHTLLLPGGDLRSGWLLISM